LKRSIKTSSDDKGIARRLYEWLRSGNLSWLRNVKCLNFIGNRHWCWSSGCLGIAPHGRNRLCKWSSRIFRRLLRARLASSLMHALGQDFKDQGQLMDLHLPGSPRAVLCLNTNPLLSIVRLADQEILGSLNSMVIKLPHSEDLTQQVLTQGDLIQTALT